MSSTYLKNTLKIISKFGVLVLILFFATSAFFIVPVQAVKTDGKCGSANGETFDSAYDLGAGGQCDSGTLSNRQYEEISDTKFKQTWDCAGKDGGETATGCYAFVDEGDDGSNGYCGDSTIDTGEDCDDGNTTSGDGCSADCKTETEDDGTGKYCGDGNTDTTEDCDDGNTTSGDGCSADCENEDTSSGGGTTKTIEYDNPLNTDNIIDVVERVADYFYYVAIAIVPIITIYAAVLFLTAAGNESQVGKARKTFIWLIIGIAILLIGSGVITLLKDILNVE